MVGLGVASERVVGLEVASGKEVVSVEELGMAAGLEVASGKVVVSVEELGMAVG